MRAAICCLLALPMLGGCAIGKGAERSDDLKVSRAVLYQNGIGYFERHGKVQGKVVKLRILPDQIADVLKSLTVVDLGSGRAINVALPVEKTNSRRLAALPKQVRHGGGLMAIAQAFRGAQATVRGGDGSGTGRIVGVEDLGTSAEKRQLRLSLLRDDGTLQTFDLLRVRSIQIKDRTLEVGLRKALDVALDEGSWKPVELSIHLAGPTPHELLVSYVVEMPTWKPAYRVVLSEGKQRGLLQGWAVVDNVSGEDWSDVKLSLTAGTPLTFTYDLYRPRFVRRPDLSPQQEELAEAPPPATDGAMALRRQAEKSGAAGPEANDEQYLLDEEQERARPRRSRRSAAGPARQQPMQRVRIDPSAASSPPPAPSMSSELLEKGFRALVAGSRVGSLFRYDIEAPVTIRDRQSALVSILNKKVPAEDVLLFRIDMAKVNPYRAVRLTNDTGYLMEKGPVAIYKDGSFVGEAVGGKVEADTSAFIPYSVDNRVIVTLQEHTEEQGARLLKIHNGRIMAEVKSVAVHKYDIHNSAKEAATMYVQRRHRTGWKIVRPEQGLLVEKSHYYVPVKVAGTGKTALEVREETPVKRWVAISSTTAKEAIALYVDDPSADPKLTAALKEVLDLQEQIGKLDRELGRLNRAKRTLSDRQQQVRDNMKLLGKSVRNADLARKLTASLKELEDDLNKVTRELVSKDMQRSELQDRLTVLIKSVTLQVS